MPLSDSGGSLVREVNMLGKIYFPRLIIPLTSVLGRLIDLAISFVLLVVLDGLVQDNPDASAVCSSAAHPDRPSSRRPGSACG